MRIALASDHAGYELKELIKLRLYDSGHEVVDFGTDNAERSVDYPDMGRPAAQAVVRGNCDRAVLICGTGIGMSIVANRITGVHAALCMDGLQAEYSRRHNNANVLVMAARLTGPLLAEEILDRWLENDFEGGRHTRRVDKVEAG
jgi:RpiB/LacA/LacB family sugar-phosphate isomerase